MTSHQERTKNQLRLLLASTLSVIATLIVTLNPTQAQGQVRTWGLTTSGLWKSGLNWIDPDVPDTSAESAVLGGATAYTVAFDLQLITIDALTISNANAHLLLLPNAFNTSLTINNGFANLGTISINSDTLNSSSLAINGGSLTNTGTINFGGSSAAAGTIRRLKGAIVNSGSVNVNQNARFGQGGVFTNNNLLNIAASKTLNFENSGGTFNQNAGSVSNLGTFDFVSDTLNFNGGNFTGNDINLDQSTLNIGVGSVGTGTFNMTRVGNYSGDLAAAQTLNIIDGIASTVITANTDFTNNGTINLNSNTTTDVQLTGGGTVTNAGTINLGGTSTASATDRRFSSDLINNGTFNVNQDGHFQRGSGVFTNNNALNIAASRVLDFENTVGTFNQNAGSVSNSGEFNFDSDTLNFNGGNFTGNAIDLNNSTLNIGVGSVGTGTFNMTGNGNFSGDLAGAQTLNVRDGTSHTIVSATADFTNHGTININSDTLFDVQLVRDGTITNTGTITMGGASTSASTDRRFSADLINNGAFEILENGHFVRGSGVYTNNNTVKIIAGKVLDFGNTTGTFNQNAGLIANNGSFNFSGDTLNFNGGSTAGNAIGLDSSTLNIGVGSVGSGEFNMTRTGNYSGDLAASQILNILDGTTNTTTTATGDFTNNGVINLNSDTVIDVQLLRNGTITNNNQINFGGSSTSASTFRRLTAEIVNHGTLDIIAEGTNTEIGTAGANHSNSGLIVSRESGSVVEFLGASFTNESGGTLAGLGEFDFSQTSLLNNGIIDPGSSPGVLNLDGDVTFGVTAELAIELGGTTQGLEYDFVNAFDTLNLDGDLDVGFINGFETSILNSDSFTILGAGTLFGTFAGIADGGTVSERHGLGTFTVNYDGNNVVLNNFQASAVPEPASAGIAFLILGAMSIRRRRCQTAS